jgi:PST family polysaccharide transporter
MSLRKTLIHTATLSAVNVLRVLVQFFAIPILARFLAPADYGIVGIAMPFVLFAMMLADAGIGMSLVRTSANERVVWSTCFWLSVALGATLAGVMCAAAPLTAHVYHEPRLTAIVMTLALIVLAQSVSAIPGAMLQQAQKFRAMAIAEVTAMACGVGTAVAVALAGGGAWALVDQQLAFYSVRLTLTWMTSGFTPQMVFDWDSAKEHIQFGRDVLSVNVLSFATRSLDNLVIGKALSAAAVGVYSMAFQFARIPMMLVSGPLQYVLYGQLSAAHHKDKAVIRSNFVVITQVLAVMIFPPVGIVAVAHAPVFDMLLSQKWASAGHVFMLVAPACALQAVASLCGTMLLVLGRADIRLKTTVESGIIWVICLVAAVRFGIDTVAVIYDVLACLYLPRSLSFVLPLIECSVSSYCRAIGVPILITLIASGLYITLLSPAWVKTLSCSHR